MSRNGSTICLHTYLSIAILSESPQVAPDCCKVLLNALFRVIVGLRYLILQFDKVQKKAVTSAAYPLEYMSC